MTSPDDQARKAVANMLPCRGVKGLACEGCADLADRILAKLREMGWKSPPDMAFEQQHLIDNAQRIALEALVERDALKAQMEAITSDAAVEAASEAIAAQMASDDNDNDSIAIAALAAGVAVVRNPPQTRSVVGNETPSDYQ